MPSSSSISSPVCVVAEIDDDGPSEWQRMLMKEESSIVKSYGSRNE
eukprot:CAMPEP_0202000770 /NCGR_PEP_ID=MMETSP0905-20130828/7043_1 /ASSEMBLY_ACC=CAM_ASM_000554 /TAXON_ID=420261 /ORGANISM="Thalassiosira antarctica, Strain CCMP982" /LENGTH=45 /DNA_ID= /DNA_START= /DNA_END= /DNA_ORIENTATION=